MPANDEEAMVATAERRAHAIWEGSLFEGQGKFDVASGAFDEQPVSWPARAESSDGKTSPEELIAAAHATCFSMALSNVLAQAGNPPDSLEVSATCTLDLGGDALKITTMDLDVHGRVPKIDQSSFDMAVQEAKEGCPVSGALKGNVTITAKATLDQGSLS